MNQTQILENEKESILASLNDLADQLQEGNGVVLTDQLDIASVNETRSRISTEIAHKRSRLDRVLYSIRNIKDYGFCIKCDEEINPARLKFDPTCTTCVDCQSRLDQKPRLH